MILIQSQLCSIDQSDLFIPRSRGGWGVEINPAPPSLFSFLFFFPFCLTIPCMLKLQWLCTCLHNICSGVGGKKTPPVKSNWPRRTRQSFFTGRHVQILLFARMLYFSSGVFVFLVCFFVFLPPTCVPSPSPPPRLAPSTARHQGTPAMLKPARGDRWRKRGQTPLPVSGGAGAGSHHKG